MRVDPLGDAELVSAIRVTLTPSEGPAIELDLDPPGPGSTQWSQSRAVPPGTYTASAVARDADGLPLFHSVPTAPFEVKPEQTTTVHIFLRQTRDDPVFEPPHILSVNLDRSAELGETLTIVVRGGGGEGSLTLSGDDGANGFGPSTGDAKSEEGASISWTPSQAGLRTIFLTLSDEQGNASTTAVEVPVAGTGEGEVDFGVAFNHAPYATTRSTSEVGNDGTTVLLRTRFWDVDSSHVTYAWDFSDCAAVGLPFEPLNSDVPTNTVVQSFERIFSLKANDGQVRSCVAALTLTDNGHGPAVQRQTIAIHTEALQAACAPGQLVCFGECTDPQTDREHCGGCYQLCGRGEDCVEGSCVQLCPGSLAFCDGFCVDTESNPAACGSCHNTCRIDEICSEGICTCPAGWSTCGEACTDISSDPLHCGGCDQPCGPDRQCDEGTCACIPPLEACAGTCVDKNLDDQHCGACGNACPAGQHCSGGGCVCDNPQLMACDGLCVDIQNDPNHCGGCGSNFVCDPGETCVNGGCVPVPSCTEPEQPCGPDGACVDLTSDRNHCGSCGNVCPVNQPCGMGVCMPDPEYATWTVPPDSPTNYTNVGTGAVTDNVTKLMWQKEVAPGTYTWQQAMDYCDELELEGFTDWRLPTRIELISIIDDLKSAPAINSSYFPGTFSEAFWSASTYAANPNQRWQINFNQGAANVAGTGATARLRCVRYSAIYSNPPATRFSDSGSGASAIRKDNWTNISWQKNANPWWEDRFYVLSYCSGIYGPFSRMPRRKELETIIDVRRGGNVAWFSGFDGSLMTTPEWYWTSTSFAGGSNARLVDFRNGFSGQMHPSALGAYGRCVQ